MSRRRLYLDDGPGERRGVVTLDGLPERLLIARYDDLAVQQPQAKVAARVRRIDRTLNAAFLDLGAGPDALLALTGDARATTEGAWVEVEIVAPARGEKGAGARRLGPGEGPVRLLSPAPDLEMRFKAFAPDAPMTTGAPAREAANIAEAAALRIEHTLPSGGRLYIEPTHALTAVDVDLASSDGDSRKAQVRANTEAIAAAARLLRLKGLGGLVAIDLAGKGHDGAALSDLAKTAFAPDGPGVSIGPISRFGVLELALPRTITPLAERLLDPDGRPFAATMAIRLMRAIEQAAGPGQTVRAACAPEVAVIAEGLTLQLTARIGPRFSIRSDASKARADIEAIAQ